MGARVNDRLGRAWLHGTGGTSPGRWCVWIPPTKPEHLDEEGYCVGPAGDTYFDDWSEALAWLMEHA